MTTTLRKAERITYLHHDGRNEQLIDFDSYEIEQRTGLSRKDYFITVDFITGEITGDCVGYGSWYDIELAECLNLLSQLDDKEELLRDYPKPINQEKSTKKETFC